MDILSVTSFFIKNIYFSSINKVLLVVFKMSGYSENGIIRCSIYTTNVVMPARLKKAKLAIMALLKPQADETDATSSETDATQMEEDELDASHPTHVTCNPVDIGSMTINGSTVQ